MLRTALYAMFCFEYLYVLMSRFFSRDCGSTVDRVVCSSLDLVWQRHLFPDPPPPPPPASHYKIWLYTVAFLYTYLSILHRINLSDLFTAAVAPVVMPVEILLVY